MNCAGVMRRVSSYIDGDLEATVIEEVKLHLKTCQECTLLVQQTSLTVKLYYDSDLVDYPQEAQVRLHETLRRKIRGDRK